jgi:hypothetical protein
LKNKKQILRPKEEQGASPPAAGVNKLYAEALDPTSDAHREEERAAPAD